MDVDWSEDGAGWIEAPKNQYIPKFILTVKRPWIHHDGNMFRTTTLEIQAGQSEAHILKKLMTKYEKFKKEKKFVPAGMEFKNSGSYASLIQAQNRYLKGIHVIPIFGLHCEALTTNI